MADSWQARGDAPYSRSLPVQTGRQRAPDRAASGRGRQCLSVVHKTGPGTPGGGNPDRTQWHLHDQAPFRATSRGGQPASGGAVGLAGGGRSGKGPVETHRPVYTFGGVRPQTGGYCKERRKGPTPGT